MHTQPTDTADVHKFLGHWGILQQLLSAMHGVLVLALYMTTAAAPSRALPAASAREQYQSDEHNFFDDQAASFPSGFLGLFDFPVQAMGSEPAGRNTAGWSESVEDTSTHTAKLSWFLAPTAPGQVGAWRPRSRKDWPAGVQGLGRTRRKYLPMGVNAEVDCMCLRHILERCTHLQECLPELLRQPPRPVTNVTHDQRTHTEVSAKHAVSRFFISATVSRLRRWLHNRGLRKWCRAAARMKDSV